MISFVKHCSARALTVARAHYNLKRLTTNVPPYSQSLCQPTRPRPRTNVIRNGPRPHAHTHKAHPAHIALKSGPTPNPPPLTLPLHYVDVVPFTQNQFLTTSLQPAVCVCAQPCWPRAHTHTSSHPAHELLHIRDRRRRATEELELRAGGEGELGVACLLSQVARRQLEGCSLQ